ncbi:MFS general substrate transporter, partial [Trichodelitschia bisporula]
MASANSHIDKLDFPPPDARRPLLQDDRLATSADSNTTSRTGSFFEQVAEGIQERDRAKMQQEVARFGTFAVANLMCLCAGSITAFSLYGHLFMSHLKYSQTAVNIISISAELALYLPVPAVGYLCDRYGPRFPALMATVLFGVGYLVAAFAYRSGPPVSAGGTGWPFWTMVVAFVAIGTATASMYLAAVSTCAKNFGRGKHKGMALAIPIAAFGLSGMWQSQIGSRVLYERKPDGTRGDVDVFKFFVFLACALVAVGLLGAATLKIMDEEEMIEEAIDELEQSGLLDESDYLRRAANRHGYGTISPNDLSESQFDFLQTEAEILKQREAEERARKEWLLNAETRRFLSDRTMWWLAAGFFLVTGPGEAFINNMGTVIGTLYPPSSTSLKHQTTAATHVSIVAITSTISRLLTGTLTDMLAPTFAPHQHRRGPNSLASSLATLELAPKRFALSRVVFLLIFALLMSCGQILLASGAIQNHGSRFGIVSALIGAGYGAVFSLTPIIISVVWGVENFGTNWGIVAMVPAAGAAVWGVVYSAVYQAAAGGGRDQTLCYGEGCYSPTFWAMAVSVWVACGLWGWAWRGPGGWARRGVAV